MVRTNKIARLAFSLAIVTALFCSMSAYAGTPGEAGLLALRMGVGAREAAMGDAGVACSSGAAAIFWNPANNVFADFQTDLIFQHHRWMGLFDQEAAAVAHKAAGGVLGIIFTGFYSDVLDRTTENNAGVPEGTYKPYDVALGISYARKINDSFAVGVTGKLIYQKMDIYSDTGLAFDVSISHQAVIEGLVFAASATNLGGQFNLKSEPFDLPTAGRIGAAWTPPTALGGKLTVAGEILFPSDTTEKAHLGAEYRLIPEFALRFGSKLNYDAQGLTAGAGFVVKRISVDYAFQDMTIEGFDQGHRFSIGLKW